MSAVVRAIRRRAVEAPSRPALTGSLHLDCAGLADEIDRAVALFDQILPVEPSRPIGLALDNGPAWVIADLALAALGRPCLPLPPFFTDAQGRHAVEDCGAAYILSGSTSGPRIGGQSILAKPTGAPARSLPSGVAKITYTSGSTASPKGVCLSQAQQDAVATSIISVVGDEYAGVHLPVLPLGVLLENVAGLYATLLAGGTYHAAGLAEVGMGRPFQPDFAAFAAKVAETRATSLILTPELLRGLIAAKTAMGLNLADLRLVAVGGAKVSPSLLQTAWSAGLPVYEGYGLTECASVVALNTPGASRQGSVGRPLPHIELEVSHDGEVVVGPGTYLGYVGQPAPEGPLATGDLGALDALGFLSITGRRRNVIITAFGRNVSPEWVESELAAQPQIGQALVYGEGERHLSALIVPVRPDIPAETLEDAVTRANAALPEYAQIGAWRAIPPFSPERGHLTANGRPRRQAILSTYISGAAA